MSDFKNVGTAMEQAGKEASLLARAFAQSGTFDEFNKQLDVLASVGTSISEREKARDELLKELKEQEEDMQTLTIKSAQERRNNFESFLKTNDRKRKSRKRGK